MADAFQKKVRSEQRDRLAARRKQAARKQPVCASIFTMKRAW
jgi:hypothetical protein